MELNKDTDKNDLGLQFRLFSGILLLFTLSIGLLFIGYIIFLMLNQLPNPNLIQSVAKPYSGGIVQSANSNPYQNLWKAPDIFSLPADESSEMIKYGRELIINTSKYFGPKGIVLAGATNGLNCQNCHLQAGTAPFGNNYSAVAATYPQVRPRSEKPEDIPFRINDCFERSLNGKALDLKSKEMNAIVAYMIWLGKDVPKGKAPEGSGLVKLPYLNRAASAQKGKLVYEIHCVRCHGANGEGKMLPDEISYEYPPLWGEKAYNVSAGLFRLEKMARFLKANMPYGVTFEKPILSNEEAWDLAAFINSMPHPMKNFPQDWPNLITKSIDVPFGPYADGFSEEQHKYGPYPPIIEKITALKKNK